MIRLSPNSDSSSTTNSTAVIVALASIILCGLSFRDVLIYRKADPTSPNSSSCSPTDLQYVDTNNESELLNLMGRASGCSDVHLARFIGNEVIKKNNPTLITKAGDMIYSTAVPELMDLKVSLFQTSYEMTVSMFGGTTPDNEKDKNDLRLQTYWYGLALEESGNKSAAKELHEKSVEQGLWTIPEQRPLPFFPFLPTDGPFPDVSDYAEVVQILEENYETIKEELIVQRQFPGQMYAQSRPVVFHGKWIYGRFFEKGVWFQDYIRLFPKTVKVIQEIQDGFGQDLPVASMRLSTLDGGTKVRPHCGPGNHKVRLQLPLYVPKKCKLFGTFFCGIQAGNEKRAYKEGKVIILDDSYVHHVWNHDSEPRSVIFVDVWVKGISEVDKDRVREYFLKYKGIGS